MKNYLFAPFRDDKDKKESFQWVKTKDDCRLFLGRLESSYDVIINELKAENEKLNTECWCGCNDDLKAEYESIQDQLKACVNDYEEVEAENKGLKETINQDDADYNSLDGKCDVLKAEIKRLEVEKDALLVANGELLQSNIKLRNALGNDGSN